MSNPNAWYVVRQEDGSCKVVPADEVVIGETSTQREQWGPFESQGVAIARRVGLIRAGKCKPV
ncbi:DDE transposase family protein [Phormidesmis priestleyi ULC007]|uniref:DDE transposase family protein n=1 Tax=Phormidesmis priestleyi ULC007 TaxID=1920490 RepID=A0A2T1DNL6_9CYAN|nr:DDE transposase family protein [Phormidesmis priestleyi]PSB22093.1 DDE transposase family protein [Phormidesmis priestleyi ULC007]PZO54939.1 MAG: DDE transposase family protein [Phormidesmis priestleyi]